MCASTVGHSETAWFRGGSKAPQYFLSTLSKPARSSLNPSIFGVFFGITTKMYFAAASLPCSSLTFRHFSSDNIKITNGNTDHFLQYQVYGFLQKKFSTTLLYTLWRRPEIIIFVKVIEKNGGRDYLLAKGHVRPAIFPASATELANLTAN